MPGFLKRDLYLTIPFLRLYGVFLAVSLFLSTRSVKLGRMYLLYLTILCTVGVQNLFNYDELSGWRAYAAAVPGGRRALVDAHCLVALGLEGTLLLVELLANWRLGRTGLFYTGLSLLFLAVLFPVACRFGSRWASAVMMVALGLMAIGVVAFLAWGDLMLGWEMGETLTALGRALPLGGLALFLLSWPLSRRLAEKREA